MEAQASLSRSVLLSGSAAPAAAIPQCNGLRRSKPAQLRSPLARSHVKAPSGTFRLQTKAMARETDPNKRVVITGMGLVSCFGTDVDVFYDKLLAGHSGIVNITKFDVSDFPTKFAGQITPDMYDLEGYIDKKSARRLDDCLTYGILASKKALENAGLGGAELGKINKERAGIIVGTGMGGLSVFAENVEALMTKGVKKISPFFIPYAITNMASALVGIDIGFMGPNYSISTACATANYSFVAAANHIRNGDADLIVTGGTEAAVTRVGLGGFVACRALSQRNDSPTTASRPWDKDRDGFVMGEGAGVMVFESLAHAKARGAKILAEFLGGATNCDAHHMTEPRQDGLGVSRCVELALADAGITPADVNYINCHATSTPAGDLAEVRAIRKVFSGDVSYLRINATKSMIGHCLGAAGGMEGIATVKAITTGWVHPSINQQNPEPEVIFNTVRDKKEQFKITAGMSNSFGFGGHNSSVIFAPFVE